MARSYRKRRMVGALSGFAAPRTQLYVRIITRCLALHSEFDHLTNLQFDHFSRSHHRRAHLAPRPLFSANIHPPQHVLCGFAASG